MTENKTKCPKVTVSISSFRDDGLVSNCVKSVLDSRYPDLEIIVVDCLSEDLRKTLADRFGSKTKIVQFDYDLGVAKQRNLGFQCSCQDSEYILLLDNDVELAKDAVDQLVEVAEKNPSAAIFQPKIASLREKSKILEIGLSSNLMGVPKPIRAIGDEPFFGSGCGMLVRKNLLSVIGGFDQILHFGVEDLDFTWRARLFGYTIKTVPEAVIYHKMEGTRKRLSAQRLYFGLRNTLRMLLKNYSFPLNVFFSFLLVSRTLIEGIIMLFASHFSTCFRKNVASMAVTENKALKLVKMFALALWWNLKKLRDTIREHKRIQKYRVISDLEVLKNMKKNDLLFVSASYEQTN